MLGPGDAYSDGELDRRDEPDSGCGWNGLDALRQSRLDPSRLVPVNQAARSGPIELNRGKTEFFSGLHRIVFGNGSEDSANMSSQSRAGRSISYAPLFTLTQSLFCTLGRWHGLLGQCSKMVRNGSSWLGRVGRCRGDSSQVSLYRSFDGPCPDGPGHPCNSGHARRAG